MGGQEAGEGGGEPQRCCVSYLKAITAVQGAIQSDWLNWDSVLFVMSLTGAAKNGLQVLFICFPIPPTSPPPPPVLNRLDPRKTPPPLPSSSISFQTAQISSSLLLPLVQIQKSPRLKCPAALMTEQTLLQSGTGPIQAGLRQRPRGSSSPSGRGLRSSCHSLAPGATLVHLPPWPSFPQPPSCPAAGLMPIGHSQGSPGTGKVGNPAQTQTVTPGFATPAQAAASPGVPASIPGAKGQQQGWLDPMA